MKQIEATLITGDQSRSLLCPVGTEIAELLHQFGIAESSVAAVYANNQVQPLSARMALNTKIKPLFIDSREGMEIYRHTLAFLLIKASQKVLSKHNKEIYMGHSLGSAYYYTVTHGEKLSPEEVALLKNEMLRLIKADVRIEFDYMTFDEASQYFLSKKQKGTVRLLEQRSRAKIPVNRCEDFIDLFVRTLLHRTGLLAAFDLEPYQEGFLLRFPSGGDITKLGDFIDNPKIFSVYAEYKNWGHIVGVFSVPRLNKLIINRTVSDFIRISEAYQTKKLADIAGKIFEDRAHIKLVLIAGPSSSGKTTTAKKLSIQLKMLGINPIAISLDDYYNAPDKAPKDENGEPDLECLEALDVPYLNKQLLELFSGKEIVLPVFDFITSVRSNGKKVKLQHNDMLVLEGIHGLNDDLTPQIAAANKFKIYVSALAQINIDEHNRVSASDNRLLRRMVRDYQFRGSSAVKTLDMWPSVQRGSEMFIFKFQNSADAVFNSALDYEIAVLKFYAEPLLRGVLPNTPQYAEASRLLSFLENFSPIPPQLVPPQSILREFIGESEFKY